MLSIMTNSIVLFYYNIFENQTNLRLTSTNMLYWLAVSPHSKKASDPLCVKFCLGTLASSHIVLGLMVFLVYEPTANQIQS